MPGDLPPAQVGSDIHLAQGDTVTLQNTTVTGLLADHEEKLGNVAQMENLVPDNLTRPDTNEESRLLPATDGGDIEAHGAAEQNIESLSKIFSVIESIATLSDTRTAQEHCHSTIKSSDQVSSLTQSEDAPQMLSGDIDICVSLPGNESSSVEMETTLNAGQGSTIAQVVPPAAGVTSAQIALSGDEEAYSSSDLNTIQAPHTGLNDINQDTCEDEVNEDDLPPSSLPPSSSPPHLFSSSPYASSRSSHGDAENADMTNVEGKRTPCDSQGDDMVMEAADEHGFESRDVIFPSEPDCAVPKVNPSSVGASSRERVEYENDAEGCPSQLSPPSKRVKLDPNTDQPPVPKRATLSSQRHQFKKLAAPFRPPFKADSGGVHKHAQNRDDEPNQRELVMHPPASQRKVPSKKISRSNIQFKSPLIDPSTALADSPTIRLTPAVQTLERKLQALKRAVRVKKENEENTLLALVNKWLEAGREVAYNVWEIVRNSANASEVTPFHGSRGWEQDRETREGVNDESRDHNISQGSRATRGLAPEEDIDVPRNTLGIMLRQLGIDPETLGWDEDKEIFVD